MLYTVCCFYCFCSATLFWYGSVNSRPLNPPVFVRHHQNFQGKDSGENSWQLPAGLDVPIESTCYYLNVQKRPHSTNTLADLQSYHIIGSLTEMWPLCTRRKEMLVIALFIYLLLLSKYTLLPLIKFHLFEIIIASIINWMRRIFEDRVGYGRAPTMSAILGWRNSPVMNWSGYSWDGVDYTHTVGDHHWKSLRGGARLFVCFDTEGGLPFPTIVLFKKKLEIKSRMRGQCLDNKTCRPVIQFM